MNDDEITKDDQPTADVPPEPKLAKSKKSYQYLRRELKEDELLNPGAVNLLVDELIRLENEVNEYKPFREKYYASDKNVAVLEEKSKKPILSEILQTISLSVGSILVGASKQVLEMGSVGIVLLSTGIMLIAVTVIAKATGWRKWI